MIIGGYGSSCVVSGDNGLILNGYNSKTCGNYFATIISSAQSSVKGYDAVIIGSQYGCISGNDGWNGLYSGQYQTISSSGANNAIIGGCCSTIGSSYCNTVIIGGISITADASNTAYVDNFQVTGQAAVVVNNNAVPVIAGTVTLDFDTGNIQVIELGGSITLAFSNSKAGASYVIAIVQPISGTYTVTWPAAVQWSGGTDPTQTIAGAAKKTDVYTLIYLGTTQVGTTQYIGAAQQNMS
jgi:hypothetical protein